MRLHGQEVLPHKKAAQDIDVPHIAGATVVVVDHQISIEIDLGVVVHGEAQECVSWSGVEAKLLTEIGRS